MKPETTTGQCSIVVPMSRFVHAVIVDLHGSFDAIRSLVAFDIILAVRCGTLFPDLGREPGHVFFEKKVSAFTTCAQETSVEEIVIVPVDIPRQFRRLARDHGLTEEQAFHSLMTWRLAHRAWWVDTKLRRKCQ